MEIPNLCSTYWTPVSAENVCQFNIGPALQPDGQDHSYICDDFATQFALDNGVSLV